MDPVQNRLKQLDLLGGIGAGVLGAGLALLFAKWLQPFAVPALLIGIAVHGWAMFAKHGLERKSNLEQPKWATVAEWTCWVMLAVLALYVSVSAIT